MKQVVRGVAFTVITLIGVLVVAFASRPASTDYISYWSAGKLLLQHEDPYSATLVLSTEKTQGYAAAKPLVMRNPPVALFLAAPLGLVSARIGFVWWTLCLVLCILGSAFLLDVPPKDRGFLFLFAPALAALSAGQSSPFLLLGFALFLHFVEKNPFAAGSSLMFLAIKPHLFMVLWPILIVDCLYRRRFRLLAGFGASIGIATGIGYYLDPIAWSQYYSMVRSPSHWSEFIPTLSMVFRILIDVHSKWLVFVPSICGFLACLYYYLRKIAVWDWREQGVVVMLISILVSPYEWFPDEVVLLPCIILALRLAQKRKGVMPVLLIVNTVAVVLIFVISPGLTTGALLWTPSAWLIWYLYSVGGSSSHQFSAGLDPSLRDTFYRGKLTPP